MSTTVLINRARARATGANVHAVNNLCQTYVTVAHLADTGGGETDRHEFERLGRALHTFVKTGKLPTLYGEPGRPADSPH